MAYNLQSLITILQQLLNPQETRWIIIANKPQLQSLLQKAASLQQVLEKSSVSIVESLESRIRDVAHKAEDIIESYMVDQLLSWHGGKFFTFPSPNLQQVMEEFDSVMEQVVEIMERNTEKMSAGSSSSAAAIFLQADPLSFKNVAVVGVDEDLLQLKDLLTGYERKLEIVPIVGMGGIGKTTLARILYEDPLILSHFDLRAWTTISQDYNVRAILLDLLTRPNEKPSNELIECTDSELKEILYKRLFGRRYLVVLDDMWSTRSWDVIRRCFPDNSNGSRIVITTRESDVAKYVGSHSLQHKVALLEESESWKLLCQIVFGGDDCLDIALEGIGRKIASDCGGLPLAINVIGGLLSKVERSIILWEHIANDVSTVIARVNDDQFLNVLSLSYNHLPNHLKPCFLYMGAFPEDYEVKGSRLIYMWMAEGFVKSNGNKSLEEEAEEYLKSMVERNLPTVTRRKTNGKARSYGMHDLLRDLCRRKGDEDRFVHVKDERVDGGALHKYKLRRVSVHTSCRMDHEDVDALSLARSFICPALKMPPEIVSPAFLVLRLLRVLHLLRTEFEEFPREILQLVNLHYLAFSCNSGGIPREISRLLNLQTLIGKIDGGGVPSAIWEMSELRHLKLDTTIYIDEGYMKQNMQEKLQTMTNVRCNPSLIRMGFFKTIPNIKDLGISWKEIPSWSEEVDMSHLHNLQTLRCQSNLSTDGCHFLPTVRFPCSLRKLGLIECVVFPGVLTTLCALPNLEVLKLLECEFENGVFEAAEGDVFCSLRCLFLDKMKNLVRWRADETNFPTLRALVIAGCTVLEEIPSGIGDIPTLQKIELFNCSSSLEASAKEIEKVQQDEFDNYQLKVGIYKL